MKKTCPVIISIMFVAAPTFAGPAFTAKTVPRREIRSVAKNPGAIPRSTGTPARIDLRIDNITNGGCNFCGAADLARADAFLADHIKVHVSNRPYGTQGQGAAVSFNVELRYFDLNAGHLTVRPYTVFLNPYGFKDITIQPGTPMLLKKSVGISARITAINPNGPGPRPRDVVPGNNSMVIHGCRTNTVN